MSKPRECTTPKVYHKENYRFWIIRMQQSRFISSVQFSCSVMSDSLWPHESQHARPPCPSPTPEVHSDSRPSSQWCHPAISSSVVPFSSCPQSLPASESFPMSQLFAWGGQSTGVSALVSFLPKKSQGWSPSEWTGWIIISCYKCPTGWGRWGMLLMRGLYRFWSRESCIFSTLLWINHFSKKIMKNNYIQFQAII